ncbi:MAG: hypothetical protein GY729_08740 [Desulfobacteraceae bacterium]|nr:hypothetical protein [Desulfobacteraceae bacterium]
MLLNNMGIILIFAEAIEFENLNFFNHAETVFPNNDLKSLYNTFQHNSKTRFSIIKRSYMENASEMVLENIIDFHRKDYLLDIKNIEILSIEEIFNTSTLIFERSVNYYKKASKKLKRHDEISIIFSRLADSHIRDYKNMTQINYSAAS